MTEPSEAAREYARANVRRAAGWLAAHLRGLGAASVQVVPTAGHPVVYGEWSGARIPVVMMGYGLDHDGLHGANEHLSVEMFHRGVDTAIVYLEGLAQLPSRRQRR